MKKFFETLVFMLVVTLLSVTPMAANPVGANPERTDKTVRKIRKELVTLPFFGVFDNLEYEYDDGIVILSGQVTRPTLKKDAQRVVERVEGVEQVINRIEGLPLSGFDDQLRLATYRAIYRQPGLDRLAWSTVPSIHIIVRNGNVTLEGVVPTKGDLTRAYIAASGVSNVFSVTNNLRIEKS